MSYGGLRDIAQITFPKGRILNSSIKHSNTIKYRYRRMKKALIFIAALLLTSTFCFSPKPDLHSTLNLDLNSITMTPQGPTMLRLDFKCVGGSGVYNFEFNGLVQDWRSQGSSVYFPRSYLDSRETRRIVVTVRDSTGITLQQTLTLSFTNSMLSAQPVRISSTTNSYNSNIITNTINPSRIGIEYLVDGYLGLESTRSINVNNIPSQQLSSNQNARLSSYLNRQSLANVGVKNLLVTIQQITNALNTQQQQLIRFEAQLDTDEQRTDQCRQDFFDAQNTQKKIQTAINDKQTALNQLLTQIRSLQTNISKEKQTRRNLIRLIQAIELETAPSSSSVIRIQRELVNCEESNQQLERVISESEITISTNQDAIKMKQIQINQSQKSLDSLQISLSTVQTRINDLKRELEIAVQEESHIQAEIEEEKKIPIKNTKKINSLTLQNKQLQQIIINAEQSEKDCSIYTQQIQAIENIVADDRVKYQSATEQSKQLGVTINKLEREINKLKKQAGGLPLEIMTLNNELDKYSETVRRISYLCQDSEVRQSRTQENIRFLTAQYNQNYNQLNTLKSQLENARAEEQLANQAVDELIASTVQNTNIYPTNNPLIVNLRNSIASGVAPVVTNTNQVITTEQVIDQIATSTSVQGNQRVRVPTITTITGSPQQTTTTGSFVNTSGNRVTQGGINSQNIVNQGQITGLGITKTGSGMTTSGSEITNSGSFISTENRGTQGQNIGSGITILPNNFINDSVSGNKIIESGIPQIGSISTSGNKVLETKAEVTTDSSETAGFTIEDSIELTPINNQNVPGFTIDSITQNNQIVNEGNQIDDVPKKSEEIVKSDNETAEQPADQSTSSSFNLNNLLNQQKQQQQQEPANQIPSQQSTFQLENLVDQNLSVETQGQSVQEENQGTQNDEEILGQEKGDLIQSESILINSNTNFTLNNLIIAESEQQQSQQAQSTERDFSDVFAVNSALTSSSIALENVSSFILDNFGVQLTGRSFNRPGQLFAISPEIIRSISDSIVKPDDPSEAFLCESSRSEIFTATLTGIQNQIIQAEDEQGNNVRLTISQCTKLASLVSDDKLETGTQILVSGQFLFQFSGEKLYNVISLLSLS